MVHTRCTNIGWGSLICILISFLLFLWLATAQLALGSPTSSQRLMLISLCAPLLTRMRRQFVDNIHMSRERISLQTTACVNLASLKGSRLAWGVERQLNEQETILTLDTTPVCGWPLLPLTLIHAHTHIQRCVWSLRNQRIVNVRSSAICQLYVSIYPGSVLSYVGNMDDRASATISLCVFTG